MIKKSVVVVGGSGSVGKGIYQCFSQEYFDIYDVQITHFSNPQYNSKFLDITNRISIIDFFKNYKPDVIVFCAGLKDITACDKNRELTFSINVICFEQFLNHIPKGTKFIYISTDYVFNGLEGYYDDKALKDPKTYYGITKSLAEDFLLSSELDFKIVRTSAVITEGSKFLDYSINTLNDNLPLHLYSDIFFSPTAVLTLAKAINRLIENFIITDRILHIAGERYSRYVFIEKMLKGNKKLSLLRDDKYFDSQNAVIDFQKDLSMLTSSVFYDLYQNNEILLMKSFKNLLQN